MEPTLFPPDHLSDQRSGRPLDLGFDRGDSSGGGYVRPAPPGSILARVRAFCGWVGKACVAIIWLSLAAGLFYAPLNASPASDQPAMATQTWADACRDAYSPTSWIGAGAAFEKVAALNAKCQKIYGDFGFADTEPEIQLCTSSIWQQDFDLLGDAARAQRMIGYCRTPKERAAWKRIRDCYEAPPLPRLPEIPDPPAFAKQSNHIFERCERAVGESFEQFEPHSWSPPNAPASGASENGTAAPLRDPATAPMPQALTLDAEPNSVQSEQVRAVPGAPAANAPTEFGPSSANSAITGNDDYLATLQRVISGRPKAYPRGALARREQGKVVVQVVIAKDGALVGDKIAQSSGSPELDEAAKSWIESAAPFPPPPPSNQNQIVHFPVSYTIAPREAKNATQSAQAAGSALAQAQSPQRWYYCESTHEYYPKVPTCSVPWREITVSSPPGSSASNSGAAPTATQIPPRPQGSFLGSLFAPPREQATSCQLGSGDHAQFVTLPPSQCTAKNQQLQQEREAQEKERRQEADQSAQRAQARDAAEKQQAQKVLDLAHTVESRGYKWITFKDFKLDAAQMAQQGTKVMLVGALGYTKIGKAEYLFPSQLSIALVERVPRAIDNSIGLLTTNSSRNVREYFLDCNDSLNPLGCEILVLAGTVVPCMESTLFSTSVEACINVDDIITRGRAGAQSPPQNLGPQQRSSPLTTSELDIVKAQIERCWNVPAGSRDVPNLTPEFRVQMRRDGTVATTQLLNPDRMNDPFFNGAAESANRALLNPQCQPLKLPLEKYDQWKTFTITFDPKDLT
jgi:TonB family protein